MSDDYEARVTISTPGNGVLSPEIATFAESPIQAFASEVAAKGATPQKCVVVNAYFPPIPESTCSQVAPALRKHFRTDSVGFIRSDAAGRAEVFLPGVPSHRREACFPWAAAVAVQKRVLGWDESETITVIVGEQRFEVAAAFDETGWVARL